MIRRRRGSAFGLSGSLHVLALAIAVSNTPMYLWRAVRVTPVTVHAQPDQPATDDAADDVSAIDRDSPSTLLIQGFAFDFGKIAARETALFPFLSLRLPLDPASVLDRGARARTHLFNPFATGTPPDPNPPLVLSDRALQDVVDSAW